MYHERDGQKSFWGDPLYERIIPSDHILRKLDEVIDFKEINKMVKDLYCKDNGRPCHEPAMLFKMIFLQFMYDISDREIEEQVRYNMAYKWFVGMSADEHSPDHSTLSVFRERLGAERFQKIFNWVVEEARAKGFVNERLHVIDSTHTLAKVDTIK
ncbi:MAG: transposase, partial [Deltaproteobacteria bacterium]|nr:transposase [Deltaproteobacteria bacterium]